MENDGKNSLDFETISHLKEKDYEELREEARRKAKDAIHRWVQKGVWLVCKSCENRHGFYIGVKKMMTGVDKKGNPILKEVKKREVKPKKK